MVNRSIYYPTSISISVTLVTFLANILKTFPYCHQMSLKSTFRYLLVKLACSRPSVHYCVHSSMYRKPVSQAKSHLVLSEPAIVEPRSGELRTQKLEFHLRITQSLTFSFKAWSRSVCSHNATLTAKDFFLADFYPSGPFTCIFSKTCPDLIVPV